MSEDKIVPICKILAITFCIVLISSLTSCQVSKYQIRKSIEAGATAMEVACAFEYGNASTGTLCAITLLNPQKSDN